MATPERADVLRAACSASILLLPAGGLAPGDTLRRGEFTTTIPVADILADSLPAGPYRFRATVDVDPHEGRTELGAIALPASRHPLPGTPQHRANVFYHIRVDAGPTATGTPRAVATLQMHRTPPGLTTLERELSRDCPVRILAFRSADARETVPVPEPAWTRPERCGEETVAVPVGPHDQYTAEVELPSAGPESGVSSGRYVLMGIVNVDGRPLRMRVGEVELGP